MLWRLLCDRFIEIYDPVRRNAVRVLFTVLVIAAWCWMFFVAIY